MRGASLPSRAARDETQKERPGDGNADEHLGEVLLSRPTGPDTRDETVLPLQVLGDILLLLTDGLAEHRTEDEAYYPSRMEKKLREVKDHGAREIFEALTRDLRSFSDPSDDVSFVVIKRT